MTRLKLLGKWLPIIQISNVLVIQTWNSQYEKVDTTEDTKNIDSQWPDNIYYYKNYRTVWFDNLIGNMFTGLRLGGWCHSTKILVLQ